jgi:hypothetical protein
MQVGVGRASATGAATVANAKKIAITAATFFRSVIVASFAPVAVCDHHNEIGPVR